MPPAMSAVDDGRYDSYADYEPTDEEIETANAAYEDLIRDSLEAIPVDVAKRYLMRFGDAIDERVQECLRQADQLRTSGFPSASLTLSITSVEIMIRFLLLRPLTQGAFLSEQWAEVLLERINTGRTREDRKLLPAVLRKWDVEIADFKLSAGTPLWPFLTGTAWPARDRFVHALDPIAAGLADKGFEAARTFRAQVIGRIATTLGFTLERTGRWCRIQHESGGYNEVMPENPFVTR
jgi:hypothetical protein